MKTLSKDQFDHLLKSSSTKARLKRELKFSETDYDYSNMDFIVVFTKSKDSGLLIAPNESGYFLAPIVSRRAIRDTKTGRSKAIICDLCYTWQSSGRGALIMFSVNKENRNNGMLCCGNLDCSLQVRGLTDASKLSRTQLPENLSATERVDRLNDRLMAQLKHVNAEFVEAS